MSINQYILNDAEHKARAYKELAHVFISTGDTWIALHAQFLSDLALILTLEADSPAYADSEGNVPLISALQGMQLDLETKDAKRILDKIRNTIGSMLEESVRAKWQTSLAPIDYLRDRKLSPGSLKTRREARLRNMYPEDFIASRFQEADNYAREALSFMEKDNKFEALRTAYMSDLAVFEGWLVGNSISCGDNDLILTELRWSLAMTSLSAPRNPADPVIKTIGDIRSRLVWAVGQSDAKDLARHFCKII